MQSAHQAIDWKSRRVNEALQGYLLESLFNNTQTSQTLCRCPDLFEVNLPQLVFGGDLDRVVAENIVPSYYSSKKVG